MSTQINTEYWGQPIAVYDNNNVRTGATDLENTDFTDYPPFIRNDYGYTGEIYQYVDSGDLYYSQLISDPVIQLNEPFDTSIAYCACKNMDIPINQIVGFSTTPGSGSSAVIDVSGDTYWVISKQEPLPIMFLSRLGLANVINRGVSASQYTFNPEYTTANGYAYCQESWSPHASNTNPQGQEGTPDTNTGRGRSNKNLFLQFWRDFGIRSVFLQIDVKYFDGTYNSSTGTPQNVTTTSLYAYSQNTLEWRTQHPLLCAWANVIRRININGTYGTTGGGGDMTPDLTHNLVSRFQYGSISPNTPILQPMAMYDTNDLSSNGMTIFGGIRAYRSSNATMGANSNGGVSQYIALLVGGSNGLMTRKQGISTSARSCWVELEGTDENIENIRKWCAAYGLFFTDGRQTDSGYNALYTSGNDETRWTNEKMCLGVVDSEGYTDGTYTRGTGNEGANNFNWKTASESQYDPIKPPPVGPDPTQYSDETGFNILGGIANCNKVYAVNASNIMNLAKALSTAITTRLSDLPPLDYSIETFLTNNPLDCVVSLRKYPVTNLSSGNEEPISFGSYQNANVQGIPFVKSYDLITFTFSNAARNSLYPHFGDFRDYEPYTHAELIVPFCGTVQINPCDFIGHDINVYMVIDYITGGCTAYIAADRLVVTSIAGTIGVDVPLSGIQTATLESQRVNAVMARKSADIGVNNAIVGGLSSSVGLLASAGAGNVLGAVGSGAGLVSSVGRIEQSDIAYQKADYELKHQQVPFKQVSAGTPIASTVIENCCRLIIYRPVLDERYNAEVYAKTVGFACLMNGKVSDFSGYTVGNINVDGLAITDTEKQAIQKAFANGVIL